MVSHHPAKFGCHRHYGSGGITFSVAEERVSSISRFNRHYCLSLKDMA